MLNGNEKDGLSQEREEMLLKKSDFDDVDRAPLAPPAPSLCGRFFVVVLAGLLSVLLMASQVGLNLEFGIGLGSTFLLLPSLHLLDPRATRNGLNAQMFLGPLAATFLNSLLLSLIVLNVLWAIRWLLGVEFTINDIYGVNATDVDTLKDCAATGTVFSEFGARCASPIATFLARPWALYWHASGAILALAVGPLQLSIPFRTKYPLVHKRLGYLYCCSVVAGGFGSWPLIFYSSSGIVAGSGFFLLSVMWLVSLTIAMRSLLVLRDRKLHRKWMTRNYYLTFAAVPFRMLPLLVNLITGIESQIAYGIGGWLTLLSVILPGELYIRRYESYENWNGRENMRDVTISA